MCLATMTLGNVTGDYALARQIALIKSYFNTNFNDNVHWIYVWRNLIASSCRLTVVILNPSEILTEFVVGIQMCFLNNQVQ